MKRNFELLLHNYNNEQLEKFSNFSIIIYMI